VSICDFDQQPLERYSPASTSDEAGRSDAGLDPIRRGAVDAQNAARPWPVAVALSVLLLTSCLQLQHSVARARIDADDLSCYAGFLVAFVLLFVPLWFAFRRKNWARWVWVVNFVLGIGVSIPSLMQHLQLGAVDWIMRFCLRSLVIGLATGALFVPASNRWFRESSKARSG
jgi:hypothetical protein